MTLIIYKDEKFYTDRKIRINNIAVDMYKPIIDEGMLFVAFGAIADREAVSNDLIKKLVAVDEANKKLVIKSKLKKLDYMKDATEVLVYLNLKYNDKVYPFFLSICGTEITTLDKNYPKVVGELAPVVEAFVLNENPVDLIKEASEYTTVIGDVVDVTEIIEIPLLTITDDFFK